MWTWSRAVRGARGLRQEAVTIRRDHRSHQREREPRINRRIRAREVMVIGETGQQLGVLPIDIAQKRAEEMGLDLVEVAPEARPPVCKILDYGKYKYEKKKRANEAKKNASQQELKEVKLRPKTDEHDYDFKLKHVKRFLEGADKVKVTVMFRGREVIHKDIAFKRLERIAKDVTGLGVVEVPPRMEARTMHMILAPDKKRPKPKPQQQKPKPPQQQAEQKTEQKPEAEPGSAEQPSHNGRPEESPTT